MTFNDSTNLDRTAQRLVVEARRGFGSPPSYGSWQPVWGAKVDRIEINHGAKPSVAVIWFPALRWQQGFNLIWGDQIRIMTDEHASSQKTILFVGFITSYLSDFSGGSDRVKAFERVAIICQSFRWLLSTTSPVFGQRARGPDDYAAYGTANQSPIAGSYIFLSSQRAIFNANGKPNRDPNYLTSVHALGDVPLFTDPERAVFWSARDMVRYLLSPILNKAYQYLPISDPNQLVGLVHYDWDKVLNHIVVEGLNILDAVDLVCRNIGWSFREDYFSDGTVTFVFYKAAAAVGYGRSLINPTVLHRLHAPAVDEDISEAVSAGKKLLWSMSLAEDIATVVNNPWGLGAPHRFEFSAELVPGWLDIDLQPDTSEDNANLFFTEADLQDIKSPNSKSCYKYYHPRGSAFLRDVGRKWVLNESGLYSPANSYDRGMPFDFSNQQLGIDPKYILDPYGRRNFAPLNRQLLPCLTVDKDTLNSVGIKVEFSFDGGNTWQIIPAAISLLKGECGIYIEEANLAELVDQAEGIISWEGTLLDGVQLNYWTSLCDDILWCQQSGGSFKNGNWWTRIRITASVQLDQRLRRQAPPSYASGSPFSQRQIYDFSEKYGLAKRTSSSTFTLTDLPAQQVDSTSEFDIHLYAIRQANEDMSISGRFVLERLWLGDGSGQPAFAVGDSIERITGREYDLSASFWGGYVYPEIVQIIYTPDTQKMELITRDLRFAEVVL